MTPFEFFSVALSFIVGLGITRLLLSAVFVFRRRHRMSLDPGPALLQFLATALVLPATEEEAGTSLGSAAGYFVYMLVFGIAASPRAY